MDEWISVNDRLPEWARRDDTPCELEGKKLGALLTSELVIVAIAPNNSVRIDHLVAIEEGVLKGNQHSWFDTYKDRVTHWMPLPSPPQ